MKSFIDLGAYNGDTLKIALEIYEDFDSFWAFEPLPDNFRLLQNTYGNNNKVHLVNAAADTTVGRKSLHLGSTCGDQGGSLCEEKTTSRKDNFISVETVDFSNFIRTHFKDEDTLVLKVDIEGKEYELLGKMLEDGTLFYIKRLFCEWHWDRIGLDKNKHLAFVGRLRKNGFALSGSNHLDEFYYAEARHVSPIRKTVFFWAWRCATWLKSFKKSIGLNVLGLSFIVDLTRLYLYVTGER